MLGINEPLWMAINRWKDLEWRMIVDEGLVGEFYYTKWKEKQHKINKVLDGVFDESDFDVEVESSKGRRRDAVVKKSD